MRRVCRKVSRRLRRGVPGLAQDDRGLSVGPWSRVGVQHPSYRVAVDGLVLDEQLGQPVEGRRRNRPGRGLGRTRTR